MKISKIIQEIELYYRILLQRISEETRDSVTFLKLTVAKLLAILIQRLKSITPGQRQLPGAVEKFTDTRQHNSLLHYVASHESPNGK